MLINGLTHKVAFVSKRQMGIYVDLVRLDADKKYRALPNLFLKISTLHSAQCKCEQVLKQTTAIRFDMLYCIMIVF